MPTLMTRSPDRMWLREELLQLLSVAGTLAGLSITAVALLHTAGHADASPTIVDDMLVISALLFLLCTYAIFFALRTRRDTIARRLERLADVLFLLALTGMVSSGFGLHPALNTLDSIAARACPSIASGQFGLKEKRFSNYRITGTTVSSGSGGTTSRMSRPNGATTRGA